MGKMQVCAAIGNLESCLGQEYADCVSVAYLKSIGESDKDAKKFVAISEQLKYLCAQNISMTQLLAVQCEQERYKICSYRFADALDLAEMPTDPDVLQKQIKKLESKGDEGKAQVCKATRYLKDCLEEEYGACISIDHFTSIGESYKDAQKSVALFQQLQTKCARISLVVANDKCEPTLFTTCTNTFAVALGLPSMPTDADDLQRQILKIKEKGRAGKVQLCTAGDNLQKCLGTEYRDCLSLDFLKSIGVSDKNARKFMRIAESLKDECRIH
jgi:hypothetical protein